MKKNIFIKKLKPKTKAFILITILILLGIIIGYVFSQYRQSDSAISAYL